MNNNYIKNEIKGTKYRKQDLNRIRTLFDLSEKNEFTIDNQTWDDLIMDEVFKELDRTYSSEGEAALYKILRNPIMDEEKLKKRGKLIDLFKEDIDLMVNLRRIFYDMRYDKKNRLIEMVNGLLSVSKLKYYLYSFLGISPILSIIASIIFKEPKICILLMADVYIKIYVHNKEKDTINAIGLAYLRELIHAAKKLLVMKNNEINPSTDKMKKLINELRTIDKSIYLIKIINSFGGILEMFAIPFFIEESTYYKISGQLMEKKDEIFRGTNPLERISSSAEILNYINEGKAICIVATHDRELSDMLKENYDFYHFSEEVDSENGLKFDYKLKKGISKTRNAIKLLEYVGYPKRIVENSYKRIEKIEGFV